MTDQDGDIPHPANDEDSHNNYTLPECLTGALSYFSLTRSYTDGASCGGEEQAPSEFPTNSSTHGELYGDKSKGN
jgi:hypothetical protein